MSTFELADSVDLECRAGREVEAGCDVQGCGAGLDAPTKPSGAVLIDCVVAGLMRDNVGYRCRYAEGVRRVSSR